LGGGGRRDKYRALFRQTGGGGLGWKGIKQCGVGRLFRGLYQPENSPGPGASSVVSMWGASKNRPPPPHTPPPTPRPPPTRPHTPPPPPPHPPPPPPPRPHQRGGQIPRGHDILGAGAGCGGGVLLSRNAGGGAGPKTGGGAQYLFELTRCHHWRDKMGSRNGW